VTGETMHPLFPASPLKWRAALHRLQKQGWRREQADGQAEQWFRKGKRRLVLFRSDADVLSIMCEEGVAAPALGVKLLDRAEFVAREKAAFEEIWGDLVRFE
jgi:hypothetical protein